MDIDSMNNSGFLNIPKCYQFNEFKKQVMIDAVELLNRLWKRAEEGYYDDKSVCQFWKDDLNLRYCLGWIDEESYHIEKQKLEQTIDEYKRINEYNCCKHHYLFML